MNRVSLEMERSYSDHIQLDPLIPIYANSKWCIYCKEFTLPPKTVETTNKNPFKFQTFKTVKV